MVRTSRVVDSGVLLLDSVDDVLEVIHVRQLEHEAGGWTYAMPEDHVAGVDLGHGHHRLLELHVRVRLRVRPGATETRARGVHAGEVGRRDV